MAADKIASRLVKEAPPGQLREVLADVRALVGAADRTRVETALPAAVGEVHLREYAAVELPFGGGSVLLTADGLAAAPSTFYDPRSRQRFEVDFGASPRAAAPGVPTCTSVAPLPADEARALDALEPLRLAVEVALEPYVAEMYPAAVLTVYARALPDGGVLIAACYAASRTVLANYSAGALRARWEVRLGADAADADIAGEISARVHYFEEGNVQLAAQHAWTARVDAGDRLADVAGALLELVSEREGAWHERLVGTLGALPDTAIKVRAAGGARRAALARLCARAPVYSRSRSSARPASVLSLRRSSQALRRPLPLTKTKFDWERAALEGGVADELAGLNI
jgi:capping protein alpha